MVPSAYSDPRPDRHRSRAVSVGCLPTLCADPLHRQASLTSNYVPELVAYAVETGFWSAARALSVLQRMLEPGLKSALAIALLNVAILSPTDHHQVAQAGLAAAQAIRYEWTRARVLTVLMPQLTDEDLQVDLAAALNTRDERSRAHVLAAIAPKLASPTRTHALKVGLAAARAIRDEEYRAQALTALAPHLEGELTEAGLALALTIHNHEYRAQALGALAPRLRHTRITLALDSVDEVRERPKAVEPRLTDEARQQTLQKRLVAAHAIHDERKRAKALASLARVNG